MNITDFVGADLRYDQSAIAADPQLSQELQDLLITLGLLKAPADQPFGIRAMAALTRFQQKEGCLEPWFLGPQTAEKLVAAAELGSRAPTSPPMTLEAIATTILKQRPLASDAIGDEEKRTLRSGEKLELTYFRTERKHLEIVLAQPIQEVVLWYVFADHVKVYGGEPPVLPPKPIEETPPPLPADQPPESVRLEVPYKSQADNRYDPWKTCNVTSIAMCLAYLNIPQKKTSGQFEDELNEYMLDHGLNRHSGSDLAEVVRAYGAQDFYTTQATPEQVRKWLAQKNPAVFHGFFTRGGVGGHIIATVGYDSKGFIVHDPAGEFFWQGYAYNEAQGNNAKGKFQHYSYKLIEQTCQTDGEFWVHFISK
ncbi:MAG: C39 family peptidase [Oculatellaceae cyanobacterium Prado106]|jgi:uncharacterized protein YvpB|nr:C39 family peptidase [Oculatellaceae cyanobacterium Prado106]